VGATGAPPAGGSAVGPGIILSQTSSTGGATPTITVARNTVQLSDIIDGAAYTLLLGEKAANPRIGTILNEDDQGYASGLGFANGTTTGVNFNTIRYTQSTLLPLRDSEVTGPTGGAFGSAHPATFNALMADGAVQQLSYTINPFVWSGIGTFRGKEIISDTDLMP
jgi:hypothetical protein